MAQFVDPNEMMYTNWEPKQSFRFIMEIDGIPAYMLSKADRPTLTSEEIVIPHMNIERYVKGKSKWEAISVELEDPISPSGTQTLMEWIRRGHESVTGRDGYADFYQQDVTINLFGPPGDIIEQWVLKNAWPKGIEGGELNWESEDRLKQTFEIRYDYAILNY